MGNKEEKKGMLRRKWDKCWVWLFESWRDIRRRLQVARDQGCGEKSRKGGAVGENPAWYC